jgi:uncharacterized membrane protein
MEIAMDIPMTPVAAAPVRSLTNADVRWALNQGWDDFKAKRGDLIVLPFIYALVGVLVSLLAFNVNLLPLVFPLVSGFALLGPAAAVGYFELARRREVGVDSRWRHFLDPIMGRSRTPIAALTIMLVLLFITWVGAAYMIYGATIGTLEPTTPIGFGLVKLAPVTPDDFVRDLFGTRQGLEMIIVGNLFGAIFAVVTLAVSAFSFPMVVDKDVDPLVAVLTSVKAFQRSPVVMIGWGIRVAVILFLAALPLFVGLMVALPVLGYATWHLYTRAVER